MSVFQPDPLKVCGKSAFQQDSLVLEGLWMWSLVRTPMSLIKIHQHLIGVASEIEYVRGMSPFLRTFLKIQVLSC